MATEYADTMQAARLTGSWKWLEPTVVGVSCLGLFLLCGGFYFFPDYGGVARVFYLCVLLPAVLASPFWRSRLSHPLHWALYLLPICYLALSTSWALPTGASDGRSIWYLCKPLLFLAALFLAINMVLSRCVQLPEALLQWLTLVALVTGIIALLQYLPPAIITGKWPRMAGISLRGDINVTAALYGVNCLFCVWGLLHWRHGWRWLLVVSLLVSLAVALLSRSKVPLVCALSACVWLLWASLARDSLRRLLPWVLPPLLVLPLAYFIYFERVPFLDRPEGYLLRLDLWSQALEQAASRPWFGHGLGSALDFELRGKPFHSHAHNFVLDTLRYGGVVGASALLLQLLSTAVIVRRLLRRSRDYIPIALWWLAGVLFLLTNGQQPLVKPHHIWFFYWLPLGLLLAADLQDRTGSVRATGQKIVSPPPGGRAGS